MPDKIPEKKSPLKEKPPRQAGQSLHEFMEDQFTTEVFSAMAMVFAFGIAATAFWINYAFNAPPLTMALVFTLFFFIAIALATRHIRKQRNEYRRLKQGRDGERTVGALLEELRKDGYRVFHDIPNAKKATFNIDHVIIGPGGVFTIETKTFSKVGTRDEKIRYENNELIIPGIGRGEVTAKHLEQSKAAADFIRKHLTRTTGHKVAVQPLLIFPGWFVEEPPPTSRPRLSVWVINEKRIFDWITKAPECLTRENINLYTHRLRMHVDDCHH